MQCIAFDLKTFTTPPATIAGPLCAVLQDGICSYWQPSWTHGGEAGVPEMQPVTLYKTVYMGRVPAALCP